MKAWFKDLLAAPDGHADELRAAFLLVQIFYLLAWFAWLLAGDLHQWPDHIAAFMGGEGGLMTAFGGAALARWNK